jgi:hypothetical protein
VEKLKHYFPDLKNRISTPLQDLNFDDKSSSVAWNPRVHLSEGRPCRWPVSGGAKAVKKEKLFERRSIQLLLRTQVIEML